jgi:hypothetical protein
MYKSNLPKLLDKLGGTLMLTIYQTAKVIMLSRDGTNAFDVIWKPPSI